MVGAHFYYTVQLLCHSCSNSWVLLMSKLHLAQVLTLTVVHSLPLTCLLISQSTLHWAMAPHSSQLLFILHSPEWSENSSLFGAGLTALEGPGLSRPSNPLHTPVSSILTCCVEQGRKWIIFHLFWSLCSFLPVPFVLSQQIYCTWSAALNVLI